MNHRSALPRFQGLLPPGLPGLPSGLPWWGATLLAVTATAIGFAYDAGTGNKELGAVFATLYVLGCLAAVVLVRRSGLFTAVIQPPLILFVAVPTSYFLFHGGELSGLKDILINCGYPLIERFPLMFFTSGAVLLLGIARRYLDRGADTADPDSHADADPDTDPDAGATAPPAGTRRRAARRFARSTAAIDEDEPVRAPRRSRRDPADPYERPRRASRRGEPSRARHNRPPESDIAASAAAADRRERAAARERSGRPRRPAEPPLPGERAARRPRQSSAREPRRTPPPRGYDPYAPRDYDPRDPRDYDPRDPRDAVDYDRPRRRSRPESYDTGYEPGYGRPDDRQDPYPERPRRSSPTDSSHHPVSRVRYRSSDEERHTEHRTRPRTSHRRDDWD